MRASGPDLPPKRPPSIAAGELFLSRKVFVWLLELPISRKQGSLIPEELRAKRSSVKVTITILPDLQKYRIHEDIAIN